jgi:cytochrome c-type biogenesis protein
MIAQLFMPAFVAGVLTFLAPCTLPLVPGYLGFISGISIHDLEDPAKARRVRRTVFINGLLYVLGFSTVFIALGTLAGLGGSLFVAYRSVLAQLGGIFVVVFGLLMIRMALTFYADRWPVLARLRLPWLDWFTRERRLSIGQTIRPGNPFSSVIFGAAFAIGWTPCVGPVLGAILTLAATEATIGQGALLMAIFSLGLGMPFLLLASGVGYLTRRIQVINRVLPAISALGGAFLVFLGGLVFTNSLGLWVAFFFRTFSFVSYDRLLDYL